MIKLISSLVLAVLISGCDTVPINTQEVKVAVVTKCDPSVKITPITHPFDNVTKEMSLFEKVQLLMSERFLVNGQNKELTAALKECTN